MSRSKSATKKIFLRLINKETVIGSASVTETGEIFIEKPYTTVNNKLMPYMMDELGSSPGAVQIHPMNILWQVSLDEFPEIEKSYITVTSGIII